MRKWEILEIKIIHNLAVSSTDPDEVKYFYGLINKRYVKEKIIGITSPSGREKKIGLFSPKGFHLEIDISKYAGSLIDPKRDPNLPSYKDVYYELITIARERGWEPFLEMGLFIKYYDE